MDYVDQYVAIRPHPLPCVALINGKRYFVSNETKEGFIGNRMAPDGQRLSIKPEIIVSEPDTEVMWCRPIKPKDDFETLKEIKQACEVAKALLVGIRAEATEKRDEQRDTIAEMKVNLALAEAKLRLLDLNVKKCTWSEMDTLPDRLYSLLMSNEKKDNEAARKTLEEGATHVLSQAYARAEEIKASFKM